MGDIWLNRRSAWSQQQDDARDEFDVDYGRVVHSGSFRRLQGKTQIKVAQIAGGVMRQLGKTYSGHEAVPFLPPLSLIHREMQIQRQAVEANSPSSSQFEAFSRSCRSTALDH